MTGNSRASSAVAAALFLLAVLACYDGPHREPQEYYIPKGYVGWVRVEFGVEGAPELPGKWFEPQQEYWFLSPGCSKHLLNFTKGLLRRVLSITTATR